MRVRTRVRTRVRWRVRTRVRKFDVKGPKNHVVKEAHANSQANAHAMCGCRCSRRVLPSPIPCILNQLWRTGFPKPILMPHGPLVTLTPNCPQVCIWIETNYQRSHENLAWEKNKTPCTNTLKHTSDKDKGVIRMLYWWWEPLRITTNDIHTYNQP